MTQELLLQIMPYIVTGAVLLQQVIQAFSAFNGFKTRNLFDGLKRELDSRIKNSQDLTAVANVLMSIQDKSEQLEKQVLDAAKAAQALIEKTSIVDAVLADVDNIMKNVGDFLIQLQDISQKLSVVETNQNDLMKQQVTVDSIQEQINRLNNRLGVK